MNLNKLKSKSMAILIAAFLIISMSASLLLLPNANAHVPAWTIPAIAFCNVAPNPAGIGQSVTIGFWIDIPPITASGPLGDRYGPMTIDITAPDGTKTTLGPFVSDDTGGTSTHYTPTQVGTYTFQMTYPGQVLTGESENPAAVGHPSTSVYVNDSMTSAVSNIVTLTVQQSPVPMVAPAPLPTSYWQTPINAMNVQTWAPIGGAFLNLGGGYSAGSPGGKYNYTGNTNPYTTAPTTSHILWTKPIAFGGALGGPYPASTTYGNYYSTSQYERKYNPIVINGYIYYTEYPGSSTTPQANVCVDLYTGQTVWEDNAQNYGGGSPAQTALTTTGIVTPLKCGQILNFDSPNQFGGIAYLWTTGTLSGINNSGTMWNMFDAMTGQYILSIVNGSSPSALTVDATGDLIGYYTNTTAGTQMIDGPINPSTGPARVAVTNPSGGELLEVWNSTQCIMAADWSAQASGWEWRPPQDGQLLFSYGIMSATPLPTTYQGNALPESLSIWTVNSGNIIFYSAAAPGGGTTQQGGYQVFVGFSLATMAVTWSQNYTFTPFTYVSLNDNWLAGDGVFLTNNDDTGILVGYSMATGSVLWTDNLNPRDPYDSNGHSMGTISGSTLYLFEFGGDIWSINIMNGTVNWYTNTTLLQGPAGSNTPYGIWPIWEQCGVGVMGSGPGSVLFIDEGHEYSPPLFLGAQQLALNATTGQLVWNIDAFDVDSDPIMAYGIMTILNAYDNQVYAYGQGPSKTTISAPSVGVTTATPITISGSVTDISAGASQPAVAANFPNGLPCVSDASMGQFMAAVYEQQVMPTNVTGVPVTLSVLDSNGNYRAIGTTTTDASGTYSFTWTPDITGNYTIYATFAGTGAYYGSSAEAHVYASAPAATAAPTATPLSGLASTTTVEYGIVAVIIVIVIGIAVLAMIMLRKKP